MVKKSAVLNNNQYVTMTFGKVYVCSIIASKNNIYNLTSQTLSDSIRLRACRWTPYIRAGNRAAPDI